MDEATCNAIHTDHAVDIKVSNDNTKGEVRCTVHIRSDGDADEAVKQAIKSFKEGMAQ